MKLQNLKKIIINYLALSFAIPFIGVVIVMMVSGYYPFGSYSMLYSDCYHQYFPFFKAFREALLSGDSLLYSWNVGMGMDYLGLIAYYLASPLNLLSVLLPESWLLGYFSLLIPIKLGLASLFFAIFLKKFFEKNDLSIALFGSLYGLCAWALGYQWNIMWLDTFALLPLVALGTVYLLRDKKFLLYTITLALSIVSNYYIGLFTCIFVLLLFIGYQIICCKSVGRFFADLGRIALFSALAIGMTAFLELPAFAALQTTQSSVNSFPTTFSLNMVDSELCAEAKAAWNTYKAAKEAGEPTMALFWTAMKESIAPIMDGMRQVAGNMGGGLTPTFKEGLPNLYCGIGTIALAFIFLTLKDVKVREKICCVALLVFFALSFIIRQLDYVWHGFHFTNMIPYRFSFLFSFVMLYMAYRTWLKREDVQTWQVILSALVTVGILLCSEEREALADFGTRFSAALQSGNAAQEISDLLSDLVFWIYNFGFLLLYLIAALYGAWQEKEPVPPVTADSAPEAEDAPEIPEAEIPEAVEEIPAEAEEVPLAELLAEAEEAPIGEIPETTEDTVPPEIPAPEEPQPAPEVPDPRVLEIRAARSARQRTAWGLMAGILVLELILNIVNWGICFGGSSISNYPKGTTYAASMFRYLDEREEGTLFYRTEVTKTQTLNDGALNGYNGLSTFTSSANVSVTEFMKDLGYAAKNTYNRYCYEEGSPVSELFLGLKYLVDRNGNKAENPIYELVHSYGDVVLLKNKAYLPLGFLAETGLADLDFSVSNDDFVFQNLLFSSATGLMEDVWDILDSGCTNVYSTDVEITSQYGNVCNYTADNGGTLVYQFNVETEGFLCVQLEMSKRNKFTIHKNGVQLDSDNLSLPQILCVDNVLPGDTIEIKITCASGETGRTEINAALLNETLFWEGYDILSASTLELTTFKNTLVEGTITCDRDGLLYTSIPQNGTNWSVEVDGKPAEITLVGDAMVAVNLTAGQHTVRFVYSNEAFNLGWKISLGCALTLAALACLVYLPRKRKGRFEQ